MKAVVTGMIASYPVGGVVWDYGQYLLALQALGFDVVYLEDTGWEVYDPSTGFYGDDCDANVAFLDRSLSLLSPSLGDRWCFRHRDGRFFGLDEEQLLDAVASADVFLNVSGGTLLRTDYLPSRNKVLIDTDPGWNHFRNYPRWDASPGWLGSHGFRAHDHFFTYAERLGTPGCVLPSLGLSWLTTRPPVMLDRWSPEPPGERWTTVMTWKNFSDTMEYDGITYGTKEREWWRIEGVPEQVEVPLEVAVGGAAAPTADWRTRGWSVVDAAAVSADANLYRHYIQSSRGELSVAKHVYAATHSGWFSCRTVCYLAAGRPAVVQDTGFSDNIPTGEGLLTFSDLGEAVSAIEAVESDYARHARAARRVAEENFDAVAVLGSLLERTGL